MFYFQPHAKLTGRMMLKLRLPVTISVILLALSAVLSPLAAELPAGRITMSFDGNDHDFDDIAATAMALAIASKSGAGEQLRVVVYSNHVWGSMKGREAKMRESVLGTLKKHYGGFSNLKTYEGVNNKHAAIQALVDEINKSTEDDPLYMLEGGPMHVCGLAIKASDPEKRPYVTVISHSTWNNNHGKKHDGYVFGDFAAMGVKVKKIKDQNGFHKDKKIQNATGLKVDYETVAWMNGHKDSRIQWLYDRGMAATKKFFDPSDAGMMWYFCQNWDEDVTISKLKVLLESDAHNYAPNPDQKFE